MIAVTPNVERIDTVGFSLYLSKQEHGSIKSTEFSASELRAIADDMDARSGVRRCPRECEDGAPPRELFEEGVAEVEG